MATKIELLRPAPIHTLLMVPNWCAKLLPDHWGLSEIKVPQNPLAIFKSLSKYKRVTCWVVYSIFRFHLASRGSPQSSAIIRLSRASKEPSSVAHQFYNPGERARRTKIDNKNYYIYIIITYESYGSSMICTHLKKDPKNGPHPQFLELSHWGAHPTPAPGLGSSLFFAPRRLRSSLLSPAFAA